MSQKTSLLTIACFGLAMRLASAQTPMAAPAPTLPETAPDASWTLTPGFISQYMFRGVRFGGASFQPMIEYDRDALAAGIWSSFPFDPKVSPGQSNPEFDFYGSYKIEAIKDTLSVQPGVALYTYPRASVRDGFYKAEVEPNLALNYTVAGVTLTPKLYYDFALKGPTAELNATYNVPLSLIGTELDFAGTLGSYRWKNWEADASPETKNWGNYWQMGVTVPFQLVKAKQTLAVGLAYTQGTGNFIKTGTQPKYANPDAIGRGVLTVTYAIVF